MRPLLALWVVAGCGPVDPCATVAFEDGTITLTEAHTGWGRSQCFGCHVRARLHQAACLPDRAVDLEALAEEALARPCADCHGDNGSDAIDTGGSP